MPSRTSSAPSVPRWVAAIVVLGALLSAAGAIIAMIRPALLLAGGEEVNAGVHVYAHYLVSRGLAVAAMLIVMLLLRARHALAATMVLTALIQLIDAVLDATTGRPVLVPGLLAFAVLFLMGARRLTGTPLWTARAWRTNPAPAEQSGADRL